MQIGQEPSRDMGYNQAMPMSRGWFVAASTFLFALSATASANATTVGDPANPAGLADAIRDAHSKGATDITIAPGLYDLPSRKPDDTIVLDKWTDTTIHADGVTLVFEELDRRPVHFRDCKNVSWHGGTLRFAKPAFTQGRVTAIGQDHDGNFCDWEIDAGYATNFDPAKACFNTVDPTTRVLKVGTGDFGPRKFETVSPRVFRLHYPMKETPGFAVNDWLVTRVSAGNAIMHLDDCEGCTLENVTLQNGGFATIFETGGAGGNHYLKCRIQPGPRAVGATEDELVGCGADGVHSVGTTVGPDFEDCTFTGVFLDDCIAVHGTFSRVIESDGNKITLAHGGHKPAVGDTLRISDTHGFFGEAKCTAVDDQSNHDVRVTLDQTLNVPIDHTQDKDPKLGTKANDPNRCGRGYKILRCRLGDTRSRGILVKADDGLIEGCTIEGCGMSGVSVGPEFWWNEANYCRNVTIAGNTFRQCSKNVGDQASIWVHGDGAIGNRGIVIRGNQFDKCYGRWLLRIEDADGVGITSNHFADSFSVDPKRPGNIVWLNEVKNVKLLGNVVASQGPFAGDLVGLSKSVAPGEVAGNDQGGIARK
jgi:hypothetical protein